MNRHSIYSARLGVLVLATVFAIAGCNSASRQQTVTLAGSTPTPTTAPTATPTAAPSATAASSASAPPEASATAASEASATAAPEASASAVPPGSPAASATPNPVAGTCTGTADHQAFFADAAANLPFDVYCAVLPGGWWLQTAEYKQPNGGYVVVSYTNTAGATIEMSEGNFCTAAPSICWAVVSTVGTGSFGPLPGTLVVASATPVYGIYVGANTTRSYVIKGSGMTQAKFIAIAAALVKVPKA
jgi:hypothetical protein